MFTELIGQLEQGQDLTETQVASAVAALVNEGVGAEEKAGFLTALARKGESTAEIAAFARLLRDKALAPPLDPETRQREILDVCGTGGDRLNTFNISTTVALVVASSGVTVAKHGNRAITSQSGSADVLEALGIPIDLTPEQAARSLREHRFAFFFAQKYHPAFKHIGPARKICAERGQRTIFNFLGPLLNPARPSAQLIGVPNPNLCEPMARVLQTLGVRRGMVVSGNAGADWLDELSILGDNTVAEFYQNNGFSRSTSSPEEYGLPGATLGDLAGGDRQANARITRDILSGIDRGPKREAVLLNTGAALFVANRTRSVMEGIELASELIDDGKALAQLNALAEAKS